MKFPTLHNNRAFDFLQKIIRIKNLIKEFLYNMSYIIIILMKKTLIKNWVPSPKYRVSGAPNITVQFYFRRNHLPFFIRTSQFRLRFDVLYIQ